MPSKQQCCWESHGDAPAEGHGLYRKTYSRDERHYPAPLRGYSAAPTGSQVGLQPVVRTIVSNCEKQQFQRDPSLHNQTTASSDSKLSLETMKSLRRWVFHTKAPDKQTRPSTAHTTHSAQRSITAAPSAHGNQKTVRRTNFRSNSALRRLSALVSRVAWMRSRRATTSIVKVCAVGVGVRRRGVQIGGAGCVLDSTSSRVSKWSMLMVVQNDCCCCPTATGESGC